MEQDNKHIEGQEPLTPLEHWELQSAMNREHASAPDVEAAWADVSQRLDLPEMEEDADAPIPASQALWHKMIPFARWAAGIAAVIALIVGYRYWSGSQESMPVNVNADSFAINVPDSIDEVTITTADGHARHIEEEMALDQSAKDVKPAQLIALSVPRGQDYHMTLADGTRVWLNAESRLEFPDRFNGNTREVRLQGEAYFEVKKDAKRPFIVHSDYLTTRVLGTSFNVRARSHRDANVTLVSGRVQVKAGNVAEVLTPGHQASLAGSQITVNAVDTYPITQWKEGFFYFDNQTLFFIMQELSRWYGVNVSFDDTSKMNVRLHFVVERSKSLKEAVANLNAMGVAHVEVDGNMVIIN
jgi:ferric-dicitrate binding protein FerR (iron transport regulator)